MIRHTVCFVNLYSHLDNSGPGSRSEESSQHPGPELSVGD